MDLQDYYTILELQPFASADEIKKAYRRLAHEYHPDKNNNDPYAAAQFATVKEAYETLSNPVKKEYYLQQRWYAQSIGKKIKQETINPVNILKQLVELERYVSRLNHHRMDQMGLLQYIQAILTNSTIDTINSFNDPAINREIILITLKSSRTLNYPLIPAISDRLKKLKTADETVSNMINQFVLQQKQQYDWEKRKIWIILLIVLLLSAGIFFISK